MKPNFGLPEIQALMGDICADWVNQLNLEIVSHAEKSARFRWCTTPELLRVVSEKEKIVSGQATMAIADTASFLTMCAINGGFKNCTTVDMHTNFMRPLFDGVIDVDVTALAMGRKTATMRCDFKMEGSEKIAATATGVFMYLE